MFHDCVANRCVAHDGPGTIHVLTARGTRVVADAAAHAARCLEWMESGVLPTTVTRKTIFN